MAGCCIIPGCCIMAICCANTGSIPPCYCIILCGCMRAACCAMAGFMSPCCCIMDGSISPGFIMPAGCKSFQARGDLSSCCVSFAAGRPYRETPFGRGFPKPYGRPRRRFDILICSLERLLSLICKVCGNADGNVEEG
jgi:hypothetical protein